VHNSDLQAMKNQAESELNLLQFYEVALPPVVQISNGALPQHRQSVELLQDHSPWSLDQFVPCDVAGDGNCLFRAVNYALYGRETVHVQLRLLAATEVILNPELYNKTSEAYYAPYRVDERLVLTDYRSFVCETVMNSTDSDMHTVLALSSVVQIPIQMRWPIVPRDAWASPLTKLLLVAMFRRNIRSTYYGQSVLVSMVVRGANFN